MAVDTAEKRFSMLNFGDGTNIHLLFEPDGTVDLDDSQHLLDCYSGITFATIAKDVIQFTLFLRQTITFTLFLERVVTFNRFIGRLFKFSLER